MLDRIQAGKYIDFSNLPPHQRKAKIPPSSLSRAYPGNAVGRPRRKQRLIPNFQTWVQCYSGGHEVPVEVLHIMVYMTDMAKTPDGIYGMLLL